jgi:hypothetical protein
VSNFAQTAAGNGRRLGSSGGVVRRVAMSKAEGFRQYAEEAVRWARKSKTEQEKQALMDLACTWTQAAVQSEHIFGVNDSPPERRAL